MLLTIKNPKHLGAKIFDKEGKLLGRIQEYDTETRKAKMVIIDEDCRPMLTPDGTDIRVEEVDLPGSYAILDGNRLN